MAQRTVQRPIGAHHTGRGVAARSTNAEVGIRRTLEPGDVGAVAALHGHVYRSEHTLDVSFEADVARALYAAAERGWPTEREGVWVVERSGRIAGFLGLTDEDGGTGQVRAFLLEPSLRGQGLGSRLLGELLAKAEAVGYERLVLMTFSELRAAAHLYRRAGFVVASEETGPRWGMERMTYQRYVLEPVAGAGST
jgi:GNAT superfamily N-acetyltransferase